MSRVRTEDGTDVVNTQEVGLEWEAQVGKGWGLIRRGRKNSGGEITQNCAEGGNSAPQAWPSGSWSWQRNGRRHQDWGVRMGPRRTWALGPTLLQTHV